MIQHEDFCYMIMEEYRDGTLKDRIEKSGISMLMQGSFQSMSPSSCSGRF